MTLRLNIHLAINAPAPVWIRELQMENVKNSWTVDPLPIVWPITSVPFKKPEWTTAKIAIRDEGIRPKLNTIIRTRPIKIPMEAIPVSVIPPQAGTSLLKKNRNMIQINSLI